MFQTTKTPRGESPISVIGAGIAGAWQALLFAQAGRKVTLHERGDAAMLQSTSHWAGGMLAPYCEAEVSEPVIVRLGPALAGSVARAFSRYRRSTARWWWRIRATAPISTALRKHDLGPSAARCRGDGANSNRRSKAASATALFYPDEGHVEPRRVLPQLHARIRDAGGTIRFDSDANPEDCDGIVIDCRGLAARDTMPELRGVKGEMIIVETDEIEFSRPVRLIHPRWPLYIIPRADHQFMIGATTIEAEDRGVSVRSALELLSAAYAVHPAFAEARIVEFGSGLRPAFPDNLPRIAVQDEKISVNGLYRHGFLLAPALAELTLGYVERGVIDNEVMQCA